MDKKAAAGLLASIDAHERLRAARWFESNAAADEEQSLRSALAREEVSWIRDSLQTALDKLSTADTRQPAPESVDDPAFETDAVYANAIEDTTRRLVHEIEPIVGLLAHSASKEIRDFDQSKTSRHLERLKQILKAIGTLSVAASSPKLTEFDLAETVESLCESEAEGHDVRVETHGPSPCVVSGDPALVQLALANGLRNAIEATLEQEPTGSDRRVAVSWVCADSYARVSILDRGLGPPVGSHRVWEIGSTTKRGHLGMGLALARRAVLSMGGEISLTPGERGGALLAFSWPLRGGGSK